jgi:hypothetical protein
VAHLISRSCCATAGARRGIHEGYSRTNQKSPHDLEPELTDAGLFMALAGVAVSLAGFAGVIAALSRRPGEHSAILAYRITNIVFLGLTRAIAAYATLVTFTISEMTSRWLFVSGRSSSSCRTCAVSGNFDPGQPGPRSASVEWVSSCSSA